MDRSLVGTGLGGLDVASLTALRNGCESVTALLAKVTPEVVIANTNIRGFNSSLPT